MSERRAILVISTALLLAIPQAARASDQQDIQNFVAQNASIEERLAKLQSRVAQAWAEKAFCSAADRNQAFDNIRSLQRDIIKLREDYAELKSGAVELVARPTSGPQLDAANLHPDERRFWAADDNAIAKLHADYLAKEELIEHSAIVDCSAERSAPARPPFTPPEPKKAPAEPPTEIAPPPPPPVKRPVKIGGCTENERIDRRLRIEEEMSRVMEQLIPIDGTKPEGRARQNQLNAELARLQKLRDMDCPPQLPPVTTTPPSAATTPSKGIEPAKPPERPKKLIHLTYDALIKHLRYVKESRTHVQPTTGDIDERLARITRLINSLKNVEDSKQLGQKLDPDAKEDFYEDIDDWLSELEFDIDSQPWGPLRVGQSNLLPSSEPSLESRIGELAKILKLINEDRARYGVPPLKWDDQLAQHAQEWAEQLARMGRLDHAPREGRGIERENLAQGLPGWTVDRLVQLWRGEEKNYVPGKFPNVARDGDWQKVAHWTQDISRLSQEIGCAIARGSGFQWLVCRFSPGGNKDGEAFGPPLAAQDLDARKTVAEAFSAGPENEASTLQREIEAARDKIISRDKEFRFCYPEDEQRAQALIRKADALVDRLTERAGAGASTADLDQAKRVAADARKFDDELGALWGCE